MVAFSYRWAALQLLTVSQFSYCVNATAEYHKKKACLKRPILTQKLLDTKINFDFSFFFILFTYSCKQY